MAKKDKGGWPKEIVELLQWCLDESTVIAEHVEQRYGVTLNPDEQAPIADAIYNAIGAGLLRKAKQK